MMDFLSNYGLFLLKTITFVIAFLVVLAGITAANRKSKPKFEIIPLNDQHAEMKQRMLRAIKKTKKKKVKSKDDNKPSLFVIDFQGDMKATEVDALRQSISAVLSVAVEKDEVMIRLESPGGMVNGYGLAASQLQRIRERNIPLTVCIDKVAASGGYLMACVAHRIVAAPFAIVGSIGVVAQMPNFHRWLRKNDIDVELLTAGEYKRTLTLFAENTQKGRQKFQEELEKIHETFQHYVLMNRPELDLKQIATGEHWLASDALHLKLIDELNTSDDYLNAKMTAFNAFKISVPTKKTAFEKLMKPVAQLMNPWA